MVKRWVKQGKHSKGWKKTGRKRRVKKNVIKGTDLSFCVFPSKMRKTIPDLLFCTFQLVQEMTLDAYSFGGFVGRGTISGSHPFQPFQAPTNGPAFLAMTAAVGAGAAGGFHATYLTGTGFGSANNPAFIAQIAGTGSTLYNLVHVTKSDIEVEYITQIATNSVEVCVVPTKDTYESTFNRPAESRYSKIRTMGYYQDGAKGVNIIKSSMSMKKIYGLDIKDTTLLATPRTSSQSGATNGTDYQWNWVIYCMSKYGGATTAGDTLRVKMKYHCILHTPNEYIL